MSASTIQSTFSALDSNRELQRIVLSAPWSKSVREPEKILFVDRTQHRDDGLLHDLVLNGRDPNGRCRPSALGMYTRRDGVARYAPA